MTFSESSGMYFDISVMSRNTVLSRRKSRKSNGEIPGFFLAFVANDFALEDLPCTLSASALLKVVSRVPYVSVNFISEIDPDTVVVVDCEQIRRVMNNLIGNAVKYRNNEIHGKINVKLTDSGDSVRISVIDNGIGISKEAQPHIFERFYRADKSRTSGRAGTGIGLAIVDKIVKEHKGRVFVKSELGKGTTISFTVKKGAQNTNGS